jgi:hypothetical protein
VAYRFLTPVTPKYPFRSQRGSSPENAPFGFAERFDKDRRITQSRTSCVTHESCGEMILWDSNAWLARRHEREGETIYDEI